MSLAVDNDLFSKGEFARRRNVTPGRVSQWISEGKISGDALDGEGRSAKIRESVALRQLKAKLEPMQMTGNGLGTRLGAAPAASPPSAADVLPLAPAATEPAPTASPTSALPPLVIGDSVEEKIKGGRLEQIQRQNREAQREEAVRNGQLTEAEEASKQAAKNTVQLMATFEAKLSDFATAISAAFKIPQRDVDHLLRSEFRKMRADVAADYSARAEALPEKVEIELDVDVAEG